MRNAFLKDIVRDLRKSAGRFIGMLVMVAIGVFMFAGLGSTGILMRNVGNTYYDDRNLFDIHVISTYGLGDKDMEALAEVQGVESVTGAYNLDAFIVQGTTQINTRIHSIHIGEGMYRQVNKPDILSGRYPERFDEAVVEEKILTLLDIRVGDTIQLQSGRTADIRTRLRTNTYRIVGTVQSPLYFHISRGSSNIGNGQADAYILIPEESFLQGVYSEAYLTVEGARDLYTYSDEYEDLIDSVIDRIEMTADIRAPLRKAEATRQAWAAIAAVEQEIKQTETAITFQMSSAEQELRDNRNATSTGRMELAQAESELADTYFILDAQRLELENNLAEIETALATLRGTESSLLEQKRNLRSSLEQLQTGNEEILDAKRTALGLSSQLGVGLTMLQDSLLEIDRLLVEAEAAIDALRVKKEELLDRYNNSHDQAEQDAILLELEELGAGLESLYVQREELLIKQKELEEQLDQLTAGETELREAFRALRLSRRYWVQKMLQYEEGRHQLDLSIVTVQDLIIAVESQKTEVENGFLELEQTKLELDAAAQTLEQNRRQLTDSGHQLWDGEAALLSQRETAYSEIEAAKEEIRRNRTALYAISDPKWYVLGRKTNAGFGGFKGESEQVSDIGSFLPLLFFLVAALVSLTTMTRLVEEQRTGMGTYKALGYSGRSILAKYLLYAVVPSGMGAVAGGLVGLLFFPRIIMEGAFAAMYAIPAYEAELNIPYLLAGVVLSVLSTAVPTLLTCREELREVPASLMRPKAPKVGKKTPLEHITPLWKRLSFLYKVTFRNIFRYKKRLFMTLAGVGGSTALLLTGFGMSDATNTIVDLQYEGLYRYDMTVSFVDDVTQSSLQSTRKVVSGSPAVSGDIVLREEMVELHSGDGITDDATMFVAEQNDLHGYIVLMDRISGEDIPLPEDGVILTEWTARSLGVEPGSVLTVRDADDKEFTVNVTALCEAYLGNAIYMSPACYEAVTGNRVKNNAIYVLRAAGAPDGALKELSEALLDRNGVSAVVLLETQAQTYRDMLGAMKAVIVLIIAIAAMLALVVLFNLTNINIAERMREIATIEVLGFRDKETSAYIYRENFVVTFIAALIGIALGIPLHSFLCFSVEGDGIMMPRDISPPSFVFSLAMTMLFAVVVAFVTSGKLRKINMIEALKSAE